MAWEKGILTDIEERAIAVLIALADDLGRPLFKNIEDNAGTFGQIANTEACVDHWHGQIGVQDGGIASFKRYCPFAFVRASLGRTGREGDYDANIRITLTIAIGQKSSAPGVCRIGGDGHVGTNRIFEKVFDAFDGWHPGVLVDGVTDIQCDSFYLNDTFENVASDKMSGLQIQFEANWIPVQS